jgi:uncharacterized protein YkwD
MPYRKIPIIALVVAVLLTGTAPQAGADDLTRRDRMLRLLNQTRRAHGRPLFRLNVNLSHYAWRHSKRMADRGRLFHTADLYGKVRSYSPTMWGENVGYAGWLKKVRRLWMHSSAHRHNLLRPGFRRIGIGVVKARGMVWVTAIFYGG